MNNGRPGASDFARTTMHSLRTLIVFTSLTALSGCGLLGGGGPDGDTNDGGITFTSGFVSVRKDDRNLYIADSSDYQTAQKLTDSGGAFFPSLSKDGKRVAFVKKTGTDSALYVVSVTGGTPSLVQSSSASVKNLRNPVFSPDGMKLAFGYDDTNSAAIGLVNVDGSGFARLAGNASFAYGLPSFSSTGTFVLAAAGTVGSPFTQIEKIDITTGMATNVTNTLGSEAQSIANRLVISADGAKAVFDARVSSGVTRIFAIDLTSKAVTKLNDYTSEPNTNDSAPCWVDATTVAYSSDSGGNDNVYRVGVDGTQRRLLVPKAIEPWFGPY